MFSYDDVATSLAVLLGVVPGLSVDEKVAAKVCFSGRLHKNVCYEHVRAPTSDCIPGWTRICRVEIISALSFI